MRVLRDTHILLWWLIDSRKLPEEAERIIKDQENAIFVSAVSIWEIAIKATLGQIEADPFAIEAAIELSGFVKLPIMGKHADQVSKLPLHHRDRFDRIWAVQSLLAGVRIFSAVG